MAVSFVLGRSGSGKTRRCVSAIVAELRARPIGPAILWLLPKQATFTAERRLACESGLPGYIRARVVSFEQLAREILAECGGDGIPQITPLGRQMILGHLVRRHAGQLKYFKSVARQPGLAAKLDTTFAELERCGKNAADLDLLWREMSAAGASSDADALLDKVHDLHLIYNAYSAYLGQDRLDQHRRLLYVLGCMNGAPLLRDAVVYVDGFTEFSEYERRALARLGKVCPRVEIALTIDPRSPVIRQPDLFPDDLSLFHPVEMAFRRLRIVFREEQTPVDDPPVLLTETRRFQRPALAGIEKHGFGAPIVQVLPCADGVELHEAPTRQAEVDAAARRIQSLLAGGMRQRDIAVLVRDLEPYHDAVRTSFREHGIRCFADRRREAAHHPLLQFVRGLLAIAQGGWPHEWMMALIKCGLTGLSPLDADALENYVLEHRIRGEQWTAADPWAFHSRAAEEADQGHQDVPRPLAADVHRRFLIEGVKPFVERLRGGPTVRQAVAALFEVIEYFSVRTATAACVESARAAGDFERMDEHAQVWRELVELVDQLVDLLGDERVTASGFADVLESALEGFDLALTPPTVDEVLIGQVDRTHTPADLKAVLVLGLSEGIFPRAPRGDSVLSDADRRELHRRNLDLDGATDRRLLDERFLAYRAMTCASHLLYVSRPRSDDASRPIGESIFFRRLREMFRLTPACDRTEDHAALIATPRQLVTSLMQCARNAQYDDGRTTGCHGNPAEESPDGGRHGARPCPRSRQEHGHAREADGESEVAEGVAMAPISSAPFADHPPSSPLPALYHWLATRRDSIPALTLLLSRAWPALAYENQATLSPAVAAQLWPEPFRGGVARLETFAACPFAHFLKYGVQLTGRQEAEVGPMDLGHVYHHVLEKVICDLLRQRNSWADLSDEQKQRLVRAAVEHIGRALRNELLLSTARNRYLLARIERTLGQVIASQKAAAARGRFKPAFAKVNFGPGESLPEYELTTPRGREAYVSGTIDRVDLHDDGHTIAAIDYKLGQRTLGLAEVYHGLALQLLTYLLVLESSGQALAGRKLTPAAAFYVRMLRWLGDVSHPADALPIEDPKFPLQAKARGLVEESCAREIDQHLDPGEPSDVLHAQLKKDGTFGSKARSDLADADEFAGLLAHVKRRLGELADQVLDGEIGIQPYMLGRKTPCPTCEYRCVCRFESTGYRFINAMSREQVLEAVRRTGEAETR
jgi:ATP-dependent helicase/nuclease subunit B